jgi:hypothetical protein
MHKHFGNSELIEIARLAGRLTARSDSVHAEYGGIGVKHFAQAVLCGTSADETTSRTERTINHLRALGDESPLTFHDRNEFIGAMMLLWKIERALGIDHCERTAVLRSDRSGTYPGDVFEVMGRLWDDAATAARPKVPA